MNIKINDNFELIFDNETIVQHRNSGNFFEISGVVLHGVAYSISNLSKFLKAQLNAEIDKEVKNFIDANINNTDIFIDKDGLFSHPCYFTSENDTIERKYIDFNIILNNCYNGIIQLMDNDNKLTYNFNTRKFTYIRNKKEWPFHRLVYQGNTLLRVLMIEQLKAGTAPKEHKFINTINQFLAGKSSYNVIIEETIIPIKKIGFSRMFNTDAGKLTINEDAFDTKKYKNVNLDVRNVTFKYGKKYMSMDLDNYSINNY